MYDPRSYLSALMTWQKAAMAYAQMWMAANEVIWRRTTDMALGTMSASEATRMFFEKPVAYARAAEKAAMAGARGKGTASAALAAIKPVGAKAKSNARRLRSRK